MMLVLEGASQVPSPSPDSSLSRGQTLMGRDSVSDAKHEERLD
jgi:hypothetical protein